MSAPANPHHETHHDPYFLGTKDLFSSSPQQELALGPLRPPYSITEWREQQRQAKLKDRPHSRGHALPPLHPSAHRPNPSFVDKTQRGLPLVSPRSAVAGLGGASTPTPTASTASGSPRASSAGTLVQRAQTARGRAEDPFESDKKELIDSVVTAIAKEMGVNIKSERNQAHLRRLVTAYASPALVRSSVVRHTGGGQSTVAINRRGSRPSVLRSKTTRTAIAQAEKALEEYLSRLNQTEDEAAAERKAQMEKLAALKAELARQQEEKRREQEEEERRQRELEELHAAEKEAMLAEQEEELGQMWVEYRRLFPEISEADAEQTFNRALERARDEGRVEAAERYREVKQARDMEAAERGLEVTDALRPGESKEEIRQTTPWGIEISEVTKRMRSWFELQRRLYDERERQKSLELERQRRAQERREKARLEQLLREKKKEEALRQWREERAAVRAMQQRQHEEKIRQERERVRELSLHNTQREQERQQRKLERQQQEMLERQRKEEERRREELQRAERLAQALAKFQNFTVKTTASMALKSVAVGDPTALPQVEDVPVDLGSPEEAGRRASVMPSNLTPAQMAAWHLAREKQLAEMKLAVAEKNRDVKAKSLHETLQARVRNTMTKAQESIKLKEKLEEEERRRAEERSNERLSRTAKNRQEQDALRRELLRREAEGRQQAIQRAKMTKEEIEAENIRRAAMNPRTSLMWSPSSGQLLESKSSGSLSTVPSNASLMSDGSNTNSQAYLLGQSQSQSQLQLHARQSPRSSGSGEGTMTQSSSLSYLSGVDSPRSPADHGTSPSSPTRSWRGPAILEELRAKGLISRDYDDEDDSEDNYDDNNPDDVEQRVRKLMEQFGGLDDDEEQ